MHKDIITAALAFSTTVRFLDAEELDTFMKYIDFITKKFQANEVTNADEMIEAMDEFINMILDEEI